MENQNSWMVIGSTIRAWMSHGDEAEEIPEGFEIIGHTQNARMQQQLQTRVGLYLGYNSIQR